MARTKNYDAHIASVREEIIATQTKLESLNNELSILMQEKEEHEISALYKYIRANKISIQDIAKTLNSDVEDISDDVTDNISNNKKSSNNVNSKKSSSGNTKANLKNSPQSNGKRGRKKKTENN